MLKGYKTYLVSFVLFVVGGLVWTGVIEESTAQALIAIFTGGAFAALRASKPA